MAFIDCVDHHVFFHFIGACFDHDHLLACRSNRKLKISFIPLCLGRIDDQLSVYKTHLCHCAGTVKRNIGNRCRDRRAQHGRKLRTALRIDRHYHIIERYIISVIFREKRTHRTVDHAGSQNCILRCLSLSFIKSARNLSYCIKLLFIFHTEREEINPFSRLI